MLVVFRIGDVSFIFGLFCCVFERKFLVKNERVRGREEERGVGGVNWLMCRLLG